MTTSMSTPDLRNLVQREWEDAMDDMFNKLDRYARSRGLTEADVAKALRLQIDSATGDAYEEWCEE